MRARSFTRHYHLAGRIWMTAALASFLLPAGARLGTWLPIHLAVAGAVAVTISGAMQTFAAALTAAPSPPRALSVTQFTLVNTGTALVVVGYPTHHPGLVIAGGSLFVAAMVLLAVTLARAWRIGLNRRHPVPVMMYSAAVASILAGATLGALIGGGIVTDGVTRLALRETHMVLNVLGFASLTIAGTLITLLPTVLRVRMPAARAGQMATLLTSGVGLLALGLALQFAPIAAGGAVLLASGALGVAFMAVKTARIPRRYFVAVSAKHLMCAMTWFVAGTVALGVAMLRTPSTEFDILPPALAAFHSFGPVYLVVFVGGWLLQTLLGAWLYILPTGIPGGPEDRRILLAGVEHGARLQLVAINGGLLLLVLGATGRFDALTAPGAALALAGGAVALCKAWTYRALVKVPGTRALSARLWKI